MLIINFLDKPKPKKATNANLNKSKKLLHSIPLDNYGRPILPIVIGDLTVHSLGEVILFSYFFYQLRC